MHDVTHKDHRPTVSVLMCVRNESAFVEQAIESILRQTLGDFEFIIVDDGSTDDTPALLDTAAAADERVQLSRTEGVGLTKALNVGLGDCRGRYIARMDGDDIALPARLAKQVAFLDDHPEFVAVGGWIEFVDTDGDAIAVEKWTADADEIDRELLEGLGGLSHPAALIRRESLDAIGGYCEDFVVAQDKDLWLRLAEVGRLTNLQEVVLQYRKHPASVGAKRQEEQLAAVRRAVEAAYARRGIEPDAAQLEGIAAWQRRVDPRVEIVLLALDAGNISVARKHARALAADPELAGQSRMLRAAVTCAWIGQPLLPVVRPMMRWLYRVYTRSR